MRGPGITRHNLIFVKAETVNTVVPEHNVNDPLFFLSLRVLLLAERHKAHLVIVVDVLWLARLI